MDIDESKYIVLPPLSPDEIRFGAYHAIDRRMQQMNGKRSRYGQAYQPVWDDEVESTCAEEAFSKFKDKYWTGLAGLRSTDCADEDVRWTRHSNGHLPIYPRNDDQRRLVLMDGFAPVYRVIGWAFAHEAKYPQYWDQEKGYFAFPRRLLHPYGDATWRRLKDDHIL